MSAKEGPTWTKGEWFVSREADGTYIQANEPFPSDWYICRLTANNGSEQANANLLSAAPELYEALEKAQRGFVELHGQGIGCPDCPEVFGDSPPEQCPAVLAAEAALAKARGEK